MIRIVTDSVASIPPTLAQELGVDVLSLFVNRDGVEIADATMDIDAFYADILDMADNIPTSSQPSQHEFETYLEAAADAGDEVLGIFLSSALSGTYEGAIRAARFVQSHNIGFKAVFVDAAAAGYDEAWPVYDAVDARDEGATLEECAAAALGGVEASRFLFSPENLTFLQKGGRIGAAAALVGNLMKLVPILTVTDGTVRTVAKVRTRKKALDAMTAKFKEDIETYGLKRVVVQYIGGKGPALEWAKNVIEPLVGFAVQVLPVSPVLGLHVGPAVGVAYECLSKIADKITVPIDEYVFEI